MCYSKEYSSSDGIPEFFRTSMGTQQTACKTSYYMAGGRKTKRTYKRTYKRKSKRNSKRKGRKKYITLY